MAKNNNDKPCAILSYLLIGIIWYLVDQNMKKSSFAQFHARQGLAVFICAMIIWAASLVLWIIPILGTLIILIAQIGLLVLIILGIVNAAQDKKTPLPIIGDLGKSLKI